MFAFNASGAFLKDTSFNEIQYLGRISQTHCNFAGFCCVIIAVIVPFPPKAFPLWSDEKNINMATNYYLLSFTSHLHKKDGWMDG